jgi:hypothetical protein
MVDTVGMVGVEAGTAARAVACGRWPSLHHLSFSRRQEGEDEGINSINSINSSNREMHGGMATVAVAVVVVVGGGGEDPPLRDRQQGEAGGGMTDRTDPLVRGGFDGVLPAGLRSVVDRHRKHRRGGGGGGEEAVGDRERAAGLRTSTGTYLETCLRAT